MYLRTLLVSALVASTSLAMDFEAWNKLNKRTVVPVKRTVPDDSSAFMPGTNSGSGATCEDAFGSGFLQCGTGQECYNPSAGESCCNSAYPCPVGSFCLSNGMCCPEGLDPESCAAEEEKPITHSMVYNTTSSVTSLKSTPTPSSNVTVAPTMAPTTSAPAATFTGAASKKFIGSAAAVAGVLGFLGVTL